MNARTPLFCCYTAFIDVIEIPTLPDTSADHQYQSIGIDDNLLLSRTSYRMFSDIKPSNDTVTYDTIEEFNMDAKAEFSQFNLYNTRIVRKKPERQKYKKETKTNKRQCSLSSVREGNPWRQSGRNQKDYGWKDLWKKWVLSLEWKTEGVIDGDRPRWWLWWGDMRRMRWTRRRVNRMRLTEWTREMIPQVRWCISKRAVGDLYNEEDTDGRARVTADEERVLRVVWIEKYTEQQQPSYLTCLLPTQTVACPDVIYIRPTDCQHSLHRFDIAARRFSYPPPNRMEQSSLIRTRSWQFVSLVLPFGVAAEDLSSQEICRRSAVPVDLTLGDIRRQIAAEWLEIAQWSQWTGEPIETHHRSFKFKWYHRRLHTISISPKTVVPNIARMGDWLIQAMSPWPLLQPPTLLCGSL